MPRVGHNHLRQLYNEIISKCDVESSVANHMLNCIIETSLRGVDSHGVRLFPHYIKALRAGRINGRPTWQWHETAPAVRLLDADHTFGHAAGMEAIEKAMAVAKNQGIGVVSVFNSSHFGAAATYALTAARENFLAMSFTHADALMKTPRSSQPYFGTNPICVCAPMNDEGPFCLDMATTTFTWNKIKMYRDSDQSLPEGVAANRYGKNVSDPHEATQLSPIGDFKGFGLGMMVDILCGLMTGMPFGEDISSMYQVPIHQKRYLGQFYVVMDISKFVSIVDFKKRLSDHADKIRKLNPMNSVEKPMVPGDPEKQAYSDRSRQGIPMTDADIRALDELCLDLQINYDFENFEAKVQ